MSQLNQIGKNGVEEFFEEITFSLGGSFDVNQFLPDTDYEIIDEALESGSSVVKMGLLMLAIQTQEKYLNNFMTILFNGIAFSLSGAKNMLKRGLGKIKGVRAITKGSFFSSAHSDNINLCRLGNDIVNSKSSVSSSVNMSIDKFNADTNAKRYIIDNDSHKLNLATAKSSNYMQSLTLKLFSGSFTDKDKVMLKRILGKDSIGNLDIEDLNKVSSFMWTKDNQGNVVGLSEEFMSLINGLGYLHNKG